MPRIVTTMGNLCQKLGRSGSQNKMTPPRNLEELLNELENIDTQNVDKTIDENYWAKSFRSYLRKRDMTDHEISLKFLVLSQLLINLDDQLKKGKLSPSKTTSIQSHQISIFKKCIEIFFNEESEDLIALSNQALLEELCACYGKDKVTEKDLGYLRQAREDSTVWMEGLEPEYVKFVKTNPASMINCLLSIL